MFSFVTVSSQIYFFNKNDRLCRPQLDFKNYDSVTICSGLKSLTLNL